MYAIIEVGAKQYSVKKDYIIEVERIEGQEGKEISLPKVLLISKEKTIDVGTPYIKEGRVSALILKQVLGEKKVSFKYRRRKSSHWTKGHRQQLSRLKIKDIKIG